MDYLFFKFNVHLWLFYSVSSRLEVNTIEFSSSNSRLSFFFHFTRTWTQFKAKFALNKIFGFSFAVLIHSNVLFENMICAECKHFLNILCGVMWRQRNEKKCCGTRNSHLFLRTLSERRRPRITSSSSIPSGEWRETKQFQFRRARTSTHFFYCTRIYVVSHSNFMFLCHLLVVKRLLCFERSTAFCITLFFCLLLQNERLPNYVLKRIVRAIVCSIGTWALVRTLREFI